jgi:hypothetical protein
MFYILHLRSATTSMISDRVSGPGSCDVVGQCEEQRHEYTDRRAAGFCSWTERCRAAYWPWGAACSGESVRSQSAGVAGACRFGRVVAFVARSGLGRRGAPVGGHGRQRRSGPPGAGSSRRRTAESAPGAAGARYAIRYAHRSTPFGLFAGVSLVGFGGPPVARVGCGHEVVITV